MLLLLVFRSSTMLRYFIPDCCFRLKTHKKTHKLLWLRARERERERERERNY